MNTSPTFSAAESGHHHFRFHLPHRHLSSVFGNDWFALKAEAFARFFGTPVFLVGQTLIVTMWIILSVLGVTHFDIYPFILLNLAFSLQAAHTPLLSFSWRKPVRRTGTKRTPTPTLSIARH